MPPVGSVVKAIQTKRRAAIMSQVQQNNDKKNTATDLAQIMCSTASDREACERFVERLQDAHNNIRPHRR